MEVRRGNSKDRKDRGRQNQQASGRRKKWEGGRKEERKLVQRGRGSERGNMDKLQKETERK